MKIMHYEDEFADAACPRCKKGKVWLIREYQAIDGFTVVWEGEGPKAAKTKLGVLNSKSYEDAGRIDAMRIECENNECDWQMVLDPENTEVEWV